MRVSRNLLRLKRKRRVLVKGTAKRPRLVVFRSARIIYASLVNDAEGKVLFSVDSRGVKGKKYDVKTAGEVGKKLAEKAKEMKIQEVVFDRGGYAYHGKVKALADGAREGGLKF